MASEAQKRGAKWAADRDARWQANAAAARTLLPDLHVRVYARPDGIRVEARLETLRDGGYRGVEWIAAVTFRPPEVTEELVVQWAIGALSAWLQGKAEASAEAVHSVSQ